MTRLTQLYSIGLIRLCADCDAISDNALLRSQIISVINTVEKHYIIEKDYIST